MRYDNAMADSFFATLKFELMEGVINTTREEASKAALEYLQILQPYPHALGTEYRSRLQAERDYFATKYVS